VQGQASLDQQPPQSQDFSSDGSSGEDSTQVTGTEESPENAVLGSAEQDPELLTSPQEGTPDAQDEQHGSNENVSQETPQVSFDSFNDINVASMPEQVQAYVKPIMSLVAQEVATMKAEKESFESARKEFVDLIDAMESSGYEVKPLQLRIDEQNDFINSMSSDMIDTAWQAFTATNPEYENIPDNARDLFAKELESLYEKYDGNTVLDRMNDAYSYSLWKTGIDKNSLKSQKYGNVQPKQNEQPKQTKTSDESASKQALIADGRIATSAPVRSVNELDWSEVLDRHAHLLDR
tara:strand:+ start:8027 stop:8905 length:879 start_codon:yes stop_codon:yes gene_type:complete